MLDFFFTGLFASQGSKWDSYQISESLSHSLSGNPAGAVWEPWQFPSALRRVKCLSGTLHHNHLQLNNIFTRGVCVRQNVPNVQAHLSQGLDWLSGAILNLYTPDYILHANASKKCPL